MLYGGICRNGSKRAASTTSRYAPVLLVEPHLVEGSGGDLEEDKVVPHWRNGDFHLVWVAILCRDTPSSILLHTTTAYSLSYRLQYNILTVSIKQLQIT